MKLILSLKPICASESTADAYFLPFGDTDFLLEEMSVLDLSFAKASVYPINDDGVVAYLIVSSSERRPWRSQPWCHAGGQLYIPANAELSPACRPDELELMLADTPSMLHPQYGFRQLKQALKIGDLVSVPAFAVSQWVLPLKSPLEKPSLTGVFPQTVPEPEEMLEGLQGGIADHSPLELTDSERSKLEELLGPSVSQGAAKAGAMALKGLLSLSRRPSSDEDEGYGPLGIRDRLENWAQEKSEALLDKRRESLKKLLELLRKDPDLGLQYAIPLNADELARGLSQDSHELSANNDFSQLNGSGGAAGFWEMDDDIAQQLRREYEKQAVRAQEKEDYQQAAFIYARLLSDSIAAARLLEKGGLFTEAATLYRDKLGERQKAADCFARAGLHHDALDILIDLRRYEAAGDLCCEIDLQERGRLYYEQAIDECLKQDDFFDASRLYEEKLKDIHLAVSVLDSYWPFRKEAVEARNRQFSLWACAQKHVEALKAVRSMFGITRKLKAVAEVAAFQLSIYPDSEVKDALRELLLQVTARSLEEAPLNEQRELLDLYARSFPEDRLFERDCRLFLGQLNEVLEGPDRLEDFSAEIQIDAKYRKEFEPAKTAIAILPMAGAFVVAFIGEEVLELKLLGEHYHEEDSVAWTLQKGGENSLMMAPWNDSHVLVSIFGHSALEKKQLHSSTGHFYVGTPEVVPADSYDFCRGNQGVDCFLRKGDKFSLYFAHCDGQASVSFESRSVAAELEVRRIVGDRDVFYLAIGQNLVEMAMSGKRREWSLSSMIRDIAVSPPGSAVERVYVCLDRGVVEVNPADPGAGRTVLVSELRTPSMTFLGNGLLCVVSGQTGAGEVFRVQRQSLEEVGSFIVEPGFIKLSPGQRLNDLAVLYTDRLLVFELY